MTFQSSSSSIQNLSLGLILYISTGILQPLIIDTLRIHSLLGHHYLLLPTLANTTGMALCGLLASKHQWNNLHSILFSSSNTHNQSFKRMIIITSIIDLLSGMALTFGILLTGGAIFVILYNSCPAWTAILSRIILKKKMNRMQFGGVVLVCIGLIVNIVLGRSKNDDHNQENKHDSNESTSTSSSYGVIMGSIIVLIGSLLHSLMFVLSDLSLRSLNHNEQQLKEHATTTTTAHSNNHDQTTSVSGEIWSCCLGTIEATFVTIWVTIGIITTGFHDDQNITTNISNNDNEQSINTCFISILSGFLLLVVIDTLHAAAFFTLLKNIGAVGSALLKGIQTVVVIVLSALLFCGREESQCLNWNKVLSASLVLGGVFLYAGVKTIASDGDDRSFMKNKDDGINAPGRGDVGQLGHSHDDNMCTTCFTSSETNRIEMKSLL